MSWKFQEVGIVKYADQSGNSNLLSSPVRPMLSLNLPRDGLAQISYLC